MLAQPAARHALEHRLPSGTDAFAVNHAYAHASVPGPVQKNRQLLLGFKPVQSMQVELGTDWPVQGTQALERRGLHAAANKAIVTVSRLKPATGMD